MPIWKPIKDVPLSGVFVVMRGDSGYRGTPYRLKVARYEASRASGNSPGLTFDKDAWRDHCGDHLTDDGAFPDAWCHLVEVGLA